MTKVGVKGCFGRASLAPRASVAGVVCAVASTLLVACSTPPPKPPPPTEISGTVQAAANVNPSISNRPSPLLVRVYELKTATAFNNADFVSLYQRDQQELGPDMISHEEMFLNPGESKTLSRMGTPETRFVGIFAAYRDLDHAKWRSVVEIQPNQKQVISISAQALTITATVAKQPDPAAKK